jgi:hypothetical protein
MELFTSQVLAGVATGAIYACMALAVAVIYQAVDHLISPRARWQCSRPSSPGS